MLEQRVGNLETRMDRIESVLLRIEPKINEIAADNKEFRKQIADFGARLSGLEGHLKAMPNMLQLVLAILTTWAAGAAIVLALLKATHP
ncbi:ribonuclease [Rhodoblastus sp.]|uniref:ribonuclease n=1 Tax=Rhodoblastus sp. TaxID=1962975 RepID=UPI003FD8BEDC